jgi:hypothetical protein
MDQDSPARCPACRAELTHGTHKAIRGDRSPWGDEYADELHQCAWCGAWAVVTSVDRFAGPDETRVDGPLSPEEVEEWRQLMKE